MLLPIADTAAMENVAGAARLAQVISERQVSRGLRRVLVVQSKRLEWLAERRLQSAGGGHDKTELGEEV